MNYIKQINEFYSRLYVYPLSARAQAVWHYLLHCANSALWRQPLAIRASLVMGATGLSKRQYYDALHELIDGKYIDVERQSGSTPSLYTVIDLTALRLTTDNDQ